MKTVYSRKLVWLATALVAGATPSYAEPKRDEQPRPTESVKAMEPYEASLLKTPVFTFDKLFALALEHKDDEYFHHVTFSQDNRTLAAVREHGHESTVITVWDLDRRKLLHTLPYPYDVRNSVVSLTFVPPGDRLIASSADVNKVLVWDVLHGRLIRTWDLGGRQSNGVNGSAAFSDGNRILCCARDGLFVWDLKTDIRTKLPLDEHVPLTDYGKKRGIPGQCLRAAFTADGSRFATTITDAAFFLPRILFWDTKTCRVAGVIPVSPVLGYQFAFAPDGTSVAATYYDASIDDSEPVGVWDALAEKRVLSGQIFNWGTLHLAYTQDSKYLFAAGINRTASMPDGKPSLGVWEVASGRLVGCLESGALHFALSPNNKLLAVPNGGEISIYSVQLTGLNLTPSSNDKTEGDYDEMR